MLTGGVTHKNEWINNWFRTSVHRGQINHYLKHRNIVSRNMQAFRNSAATGASRRELPIIDLADGTKWAFIFVPACLPGEICHLMHIQGKRTYRFFLPDNETARRAEVTASWMLSCAVECFYGTRFPESNGRPLRGYVYGDAFTHEEVEVAAPNPPAYNMHNWTRMMSMVVAQALSVLPIEKQRDPVASVAFVKDALESARRECNQVRTYLLGCLLHNHPAPWDQAGPATPEASETPMDLTWEEHGYSQALFDMAHATARARNDEETQNPERRSQRLAQANKECYLCLETYEGDEYCYNDLCPHRTCIPCCERYYNIGFIHNPQMQGHQFKRAALCFCKEGRNWKYKGSNNLVAIQVNGHRNKMPVIGHHAYFSYCPNRRRYVQRYLTHITDPDIWMALLHCFGELVEGKKLTSDDGHNKQPVEFMDKDREYLFRGSTQINCYLCRARWPEHQMVCNSGCHCHHKICRMCFLCLVKPRHRRRLHCVGPNCNAWGMAWQCMTDLIVPTEWISSHLYLLDLPDRDVAIREMRSILVGTNANHRDEEAVGPGDNLDSNDSSSSSSAS